MKKSATDKLPHFHPELLAEAAGPKVYPRGVAYHAEGQVEIVSADAGTVKARVLGTHMYQVELSIDADGEPDGHCSCPAFRDFGFCKHMVATALAANELKPGEVGSQSGRLGTVRNFLKAQGTDTLVQMLMDLAEQDMNLLARLELLAGMNHKDKSRSIKAFEKAITAATRIRGFLDYEDVPEWARGVESLLQGVSTLTAAGYPTEAAGLAITIIDKIEAAMDKLDDSDGYCADLLDQAAAIHLEACRKALPDSIALACTLFEREVNSRWDTFLDAHKIYADLLGPKGLAEYQKLAETLWAETKPQRRRRAHDFNPEFARRTFLFRILDDLAKMANDKPRRIALYKSNMESAHDCVALTRLYLGYNMKAEARKTIEDGLFEFEDEPHEELASLATQLGIALRSGGLKKPTKRKVH